MNGKPTDEYVDMVNQQRKWLLEFATTEARAKYIVETIRENLRRK